MEVICPKCNATYNVPTGKIPPGKTAKGTCRKCGQKIVIRSSAEEMSHDNPQLKKSIPKESQPEKRLETEQRIEKQKDARAKEGKTKSAFFKRIETIEEANKVIKDASYLFIIVATIYAFMGFFLDRGSLIDAVVFFILALLLMFLKSRVVAVLLLLFSSGVFISTSLAKLGLIKSGGSNIFLALIVLWDSIKAVEATFKLHGKFKTLVRKGSTGNVTLPESTAETSSGSEIKEDKTISSVISMSPEYKKHRDPLIIAFVIFIILALSGLGYVATKGRKVPLAKYLDFLSGNQSNRLERLNAKTTELYNQRKYQEAEKVAKEALSLAEKIYGKNHLNVTIILGKLSRLKSYQKKFKEAEPIIKRSIAIKKRELGNNHVEVAKALNILAGNYWSQGRYGESLKYEKRALAILEKAHGSDSPKLVFVLQSMADNYRRIGSLEKAKEVEDRAVKIRGWAAISKYLDRCPDAKSQRSLDPLAPEIAKCLAGFRGTKLKLTGVRSLTSESAKYLSGFKGAVIDLSDVNKINEEVAENLSRFKRSINLSGLRELSPEIAERLSKHKSGFLWLDGIESLSPKAAQHLNKIGGILSLRKIRSLSTETAKELSPCKLLILDGIREITPQTAKKLSMHDGNIYLRGLMEITRDVKDIFDKSKKNVHLNKRVKIKG